MKYDYTSFYPPDRTLRWIKRPMITIEIFGEEKSLVFDALIDSGADCSLFNLQIAQALGIDLSLAKKRVFTGISGQIEGYYLDRIKIKIRDMDRAIEIPICFVKSDSVGLLLGQDGFFDQYRIKFDKGNNVFEITEKP